MRISKIEWAATSRPPVLNSGEVHIWRLCTADLVNAEPELRQLLSADECQRGEKYHFEKDRINFIIRRGILRRLLGSYVGVQAVDLCFIYNNFDKPALEADIQVGFNSSSSRDISMFAFTFDAKIGIDIEYVDAEFPKNDIAERYFSTDEVQAIRDLRPDLQTAAFFDCWTKKEAYVKAIGEGMSHPLPNLAASEATKGWNIMSFIPEENFIASLAYEGTQRAHKYFRWLGTVS